MNTAFLKKLFLITLFCLAVSILPLRAQAASLTLNLAAIQGSDVVVSGKGSASSEDGILHLYTQEVYESGTQGIEVAQAPAGSDPIFVFPLGKNTASSNLFRKFTVIAVRKGVPTVVSNSRYIENPEGCASHTAGRRDGSKKGLLPAESVTNPQSLAKMGIHQIVYNLNMGTLCSGSGINYTYNGKTWSFDVNLVRGFDAFIPRMNQNGIQVSLILLNNLTLDPNLIHPLSVDTFATNYYAFNTGNAVGVEQLEAAASFLAQRYSNTGHGTVDNWIVGNEVNAGPEWNYMSPSVGFAAQVQEYAKAVRIFYNGIRSENANARIYISLDNEWSRGSAAGHFGARPYLETFNNYICSEGNISWNVAAHPYNAVLSDPVAWTDSSLHPHSQNAAYYTMENIDVLTDYLCSPALLAPDGQVRSVLCSEVGYTSTLGQEAQAASVVYGYLQACFNQHIDGFILNREKDHINELVQGLALGLTDVNGTKNWPGITT